MLRGTRILENEEAKTFIKTIDKLRYEASRLNFEEIIVPIIWESQPFLNKTGIELSKQMWRFKDLGDRDVCLIPEVTAIIQELYNNSWKKSRPKPIKVFYISRCYRYERPQLGRYREFTQFGMEILGDKDYPKQDLLEIIKNDLLHDIKDQCNFNENIKRGLGYYIEDGFEVSCDLLGSQKQILGGGKYPEGIGFAIGIERLILARNIIHKEN